MKWKMCADREITSVLSAFFVIAFCTFISIPAHSQVTGATVTGTISDASGAVIAGAQISARNAATGVTRDTTADSSGLYSLPNLAPGDYELKVSAKGFSTAVQSGLSLAVGQQQQLNFTLKVGETSQTVQVTEAAPQIELTSSTLTGQVEAETVRELPLNGRDWTSLATLQPGVNKIENQMSYDTSARGNRGFGSELTISGQRSTFNNYRIDGISVVDYAMAAPGNVIGVVLGTEAIQEFSVLTGGFSAEYGRATGGVVNAISKSGTNAFHGDAYEFLRNRVLDANDYFTKTTPDPLNPGHGLGRPTFRRNQFGASAGGPIIKDKTFIFGDYEGLRQAKGIPTSIKVLSDTARLGIISGQSVPPANLGANTPCLEPDGNPGHYLDNNGTVCVSDYTARLLALFPHANAAAIDANRGVFAFAGLQVVPENFYTFRVDHKIGNNDNVFGTYLYDDTDYIQPDKMNDVNTHSHTRRQTVSIEETHTFGASFVNSARIGYNRDHVINQFTPSAVNPAAADTSRGTIAGQTAGRLSFSGTIADFFGGVNAGSHYLHTWNSYQAYDDAFLTRGTHSIKFGAGVEWMPYNFEAFQNPGGRWKGFKNITNFLIGKASSYEAGLPQTVVPREFRQTLFGAYVQDDWKVRPNFTANIGLRYEMTTVLKDGLNRIGSLVNIVEGSAPSTLPDANLRCQANFDASATYSVATQVGTACGSTGPYYSNPTLRNFEPRVGFVWDPFKSGKTSVRGGFGVYDVLPLPGYFILQQNQAAPFMVFKSTKAVAGQFKNGQDGSFLVSSIASRLASSTIETKPHRSYVMQWNLNVQRQLNSDTTLTVGYVGSRGVHLLQRGDDGNMTFPTLTSAGYLFPCGPDGSGATCVPGFSPTGTTASPISAQLNQPYGVIRYIYWGTDSNYHALNVNLAKTLKHGIQYQVAYSFAKSLDDNSQSIAGDSFSNAINSPWWFLPKLFRGPSDFNVTHALSINGLWDVPGPKQGVAKTALGGWELGGIVKVNSGVPTTPIIGDDPLGLGNGGADQFGFLNKVSGCDPINHGYAGSAPGAPVWIKASCYALPMVSATSPLASQCADFAGASPAPTGMVYCSNLSGTVSRNSVYGPRLFNLDFSVLKNFPITRISETFKVQFRAEMFNITNHDNFVPPQPGSGDGNSALFASDGSSNGDGVISGLATEPREIQFAVKFVW